MLCPNGTVKPFLVSLVEPVAYLKSELEEYSRGNVEPFAEAFYVFGVQRSRSFQP